MKRIRRQRPSLHKGAALNRRSLWLFILAGCFIFGILAGQILARRSITAESSQLSTYLKTYLTLEPERSASFFFILFLYFRYPCLAFFLGFSAGREFFLPLITAVQGFFFAYSVNCFTVALGGQGWLLAAATVGLRCIFTLPCYFFIALLALERVRIGDTSAGKKERLIGDTAYLLRCACCVGLLFLAALLDYSAAPKVLMFVKQII